MYWDRERNGIISGVIPHSTGLPRAVSSVFGINVHKDRSVSRNMDSDVAILYDWYQKERKKYPQGSILINPSSSHHKPYPTSIYGPGAWAAVDLLFFLPETPMTYVGEECGWMLNLDMV